MTRVLVVEDSATQAHRLRLVLESHGIDVEVATDGRAGLELCRNREYDLILSDVIMPELDGYELCRRIKSDASTQRLPVILVTSLSEPMDIIRGLECGADNFITKPYEPEYLVERIQRLLEQKELRKDRKLARGVELFIMGNRLTITSEKEQMVDLLISTFEEMMRTRKREYEAKLRMETLRESQLLLQSALDALSASIAIVDENGNIVAVNQAWRQFATRQAWPVPAAGLGLPYLDVWRRGFGCVPEREEETVAGVRTVIEGREPAYVTEYPAQLSGGTRWFGVSATCFDGLGPRLVAVEHEDITARKELENQLRHAQKLEGIGQLAGGVAHDFNNVLAAITSCAGLLMEDAGEGDPRAEELRDILDAADRGTALTRQLLAFSRKQVLRPVVCDLNQIVGNFEKMLRRVIGRDIDLASDLEPSLGHVKVDPNQVEQVLLNLAVNARDAMPAGGKLTISTSNVQLDPAYAARHGNVAPGPYVLLSVTDSGTGMPPDVQARIFEPFFTTKERGKGTGLGLATVYGIVQQSGGHIFVYSELGRGTSFKIYLPLAEGKLERQARPSLIPRVRSGGNEVVLLVEDDPTLRRIASRILGRAEYRVLVAGNPREALEVSGSHTGRIDLLLTDVVMPEMSGTELASHLREQRRDLKVLFMSGYSGAAIARHGAIPSEAAFLEKPFTPAALTQKIESVLASSSRSLPASRPG